MHVAVKFHAGNHVNMALPGVFDHVPDFVARVAGVGIHQLVALVLDAGLGIEVILVGLEPCQQVNLPLDFLDPQQLAVAEVHHKPAIGQRGPVANRGCGQHRPRSRAFHHLQQGLNAVEKASRGGGANLRAFRGHLKGIGLTRIRPGALFVAGQGRAFPCATQQDGRA